LLPKRFL
jgi:hypothetical protein